MSMRTRAQRLLAFTAAALLTLVLAVIFLFLLKQTGRPSASASGEVRSHASPSAERLKNHEGPPWVYGSPEARFTVVEYGDLECPYCAASFPRLRRWIDGQHEVNWQWGHFPLVDHELESTREARRIECVGAVEGNGAFWSALEKRYSGQGERDAPTSATSTALAECLASTHPDQVINQQRADAVREGVSVTPTLVVIDRRSGKRIVLQGVPEDDGLLSALDLLTEASP